MARATVTSLVLFTITVAVLLSTVISSVLLVANALHLVADSNALSVTTAGGRASWKSAIHSSNSGLAETGSVVANTVGAALLGARLQRTIRTGPSKLALAGVVLIAATEAVAVVGA